MPNGGFPKKSGTPESSISRSDIYLSIYIHLSIYLSIHPSIHPSIYLSIYRSIHLSIHPSIYLSTSLSIDLSIYPFIHPSIHRSIDPSIHRSIDPSIHRSIDPSIHLSIYLIHIYIFASSTFWIPSYLAPICPRLRPILLSSLLSCDMEKKSAWPSKIIYTLRRFFHIYVNVLDDKYKNL